MQMEARVVDRVGLIGSCAGGSDKARHACTGFPRVSVWCTRSL
jgi:hypothetical protein